MKKRLLSILLATALLLSIAVPTAFAVDGNQATDSASTKVSVNTSSTGSGLTLTVTNTDQSVKYRVAYVDTETEYIQGDHLTDPDEPVAIASPEAMIAKYANFGDLKIGADDALTELTNPDENRFLEAAAGVYSLSIPIIADGKYYVVAWPEGASTASGVEIEVKDNKLKIPTALYTLDANGGNLPAGVSSTTLEVKTYTATELTAAINVTPTKANHTFLGWGDATTDTAAEGLTVAGASDTSVGTLYAVWKEKDPKTPAPTAKTVTYKNGLTLADVALESGWAWDDDTTALDTVKSYTCGATAAETTTTKETTANVAVTVNKGEVELDETAATVKIGTKLADIDPATLFSVVDKNAEYTLPKDGVTLTWADADKDKTIADGDITVTLNVALGTDAAALYGALAPVTVTLTGATRTDTTWKVEPVAPAKTVEGTTAKLTAEANSGGTISYVSADPTIVDVAADGTLTFKKVGGPVEITVTAAQTDEHNALVKKINITVTSAAAPHAPFMKGYESDGKTNNFGPDDQLTRAQAVTILARLDGWTDGQTVTVDNMYSDVKNVWYYNAIAYAKKNGIVEGYEDGTFQPDKAITRAEFSKMLARMSNGSQDPTGYNSALSDAKGHWANVWIGYLETEFPGSITGREDGLFHPNDDITRAEVAKIVNAYKGRLQSVSAKEADQLAADLNKFDDVKRCTWYYNNVIEATVPHDASDVKFHTAG